MNPNPDDSRWSASPSNNAHARQYMIAPAGRSMPPADLIQRLLDLGIADVARTFEPHGTACPPVAVARMSAETAAKLRASAGGTLIVEADPPLRPASTAMTPASVCAAVTAAVAVPLGPGFTTTIQVSSESGEPIARAMVELVGQQSTAQGMTDNAGKVTLTLPGELPGTVTELLIKPRAGFWSLCRSNPELQAEALNTINLRPLAQADEFGWGGRAMRFDQLPSEYRGAGVKIALIDTGMALSHSQLGAIKRGFDATRGDERAWSKDAVGHGTPCAGILAAAGAATGVHGYAPDAELHVCKLPLDATCSDLVSALDYCVEAGADIACIGFSCARGATIVERCIVAAKQRGMAVIAAAGSIGGPVQFPACSPHVLAVGAIGQTGTFPADSLQAVLAEAARDNWAASAGSGMFVPAFSCVGPEIDLLAPGVAVVACQSPDGYAACDGTSLAVPHVAALAALVLAHRDEFRREFATRDARRVERLFQILKETAQTLGDPLRTGAGVPDAPRALGLNPQPRPFTAPVNVGLPELRNAMRLAGLTEPGKYQEFIPEPARGPAVVWHQPLDFAQASVLSTSDGGTDVRSLREALLMAGLSTGP